MEPAFTRTSHLPFFLDQATLSHSISRRPIFTLSYHVHTGLPNGILHLRLPNKTICHLPHTCHMSRPSPPPWSHRTKSIWWTVELMKLLIMVYNLLSYPLTPSLFGSLIFLSTLPSNTLSLCTSLSLRDQNDMQKYGGECFGLYDSGKQMGRQGTMDRMVTRNR
jgi:hypothetical protein